MCAPTCVLGVLCFSARRPPHNSRIRDSADDFLRHVLTNPSDTQDSLSRCCRLGARRSSSPPSLLHEHPSFLVKSMMLPAFLERVGLLLVAFLTRSVQRSCFRPGTRGSAPFVHHFLLYSSISCFVAPLSSAHCFRSGAISHGWCCRPGARRSLLVGVSSCLSMVMDGAVVLERVGLLLVGVSRGPLNVLASVLERVGLLIMTVGISTRSFERSCFRRGAHRSSPCRFSATIGHGHAVVCLL